MQYVVRYFRAATFHRILIALTWALSLARCAEETVSRDDDHIVFVLPRDIQQIDPRLIGDAYGLKVSRLIFSSLVTINPHSLEPVVDLAERVEVVSPTLYRVEIKKGLKFSDGSQLNAALANPTRTRGRRGQTVNPAEQMSLVQNRRTAYRHVVDTRYPHPLGSLPPSTESARFSSESG